MKNKILTLGYIILAAGNIFSQENILQNVLDAAHYGLSDYLNKIPNGEESKYGFNNREEFSLAQCGKPYEIFSLTKEFFSDENLADKRNYLVSTGEWRIAVTMKGENRVILTVAKMNGAWEVVCLGSEG